MAAPSRTPLSPLQEQIFEHLCSHVLLDSRAALMLIDPLSSKGDAIVFVSEQWELTTGFKAEDAVGSDCRAFLVPPTQSADPLIEKISEAMAAHRACKALITCYRSGDPERPFWNMLSISPIVHQGSLVFYLANLQDYTSPMSRLVLPQGFCRSSAFHQRTVPLLADVPAAIGARAFTAPAVLETAEDDEGTSTAHSAPADLAATAAKPQVPLIRRLGWSGVALEPEFLIMSVAGGLRALGADVVTQERASAEDEQFVVDARLPGPLTGLAGSVDAVALRVVVCDDPAAAARSGVYRILCTRLAGDTSDYHDTYRRLQSTLHAEEWTTAAASWLRLVSSWPSGLASFRDGGEAELTF